MRAGAVTATLAGTRAGTYRQSRRTSRLWAGAGLVVGGLNALAPGDLTAVERLLASGILLASFIPTWCYVRKGEPGVPFLPLFGAVYAVHFALPVFLLESFRFRGWFFSDGVLEKTLLLAFLGLMLLLVAFYSLPGISTARVLPRVGMKWSAARVKHAAPLIAGVGLCLTYARMTMPIPLVFQQVVDFLASFSLFAILMLFILQLKGELDRFGKVLLWGVLLPAQLAMDLSTGAVYQVMKDLLPMLMIYWGVRRRVPWQGLVLALFVLVLLRGNQASFRGQIRSDPYQAMSIIERSRLYVDLAISTVTGGGLGNAYAQTLERVSHLTTFADVVEQTPGLVPYWGGESYRTLLTSPIPRIVWPDKPTKTLGQAFGHRYGRLGPQDSATSENMPQLVEMYANFGPIGVLLGMFIIGMIYRVLHHMINHAKAEEGGMLIGAVIFSNLLSIESDASLVFGSVLQHAVLLYLLMKPLQARRAHGLVASAYAAR